MTNASPSISLLIRPTFATYRAAYLSPVQVGGALVSLAVLSAVAWPKAGPLVLVIIVVIVLLAAGYVALYLRNTRIELRDGQVLETTVFGGTRQRAISDVAKIVFVGQLLTGGRTVGFAGSNRNLFLVDADGRRIARASGAAWSVDDLDTLVKTFGDTELLSAPSIDTKELSKQFPTLLPWGEQHPSGLTWLVVAGVLAVIALVIWVSVA